MSKPYKKTKQTTKKKVDKKAVSQDYSDNLKCIDLINIIRKTKDENKANKAFETLLSMLIIKIQRLISRFNIPGYDHSDVLQEALYALRYKAIKDYDKERGTGVGPALFDKFALLFLLSILFSTFC